jgi:RNA recognition motif-containing protein
MNIFVTNFSRRANSYSVELEFRPYGEVESVDLWFHDDERSLRFAIVQMPDEAKARRAIRRVNGTEFSPGRRLWVEEAPESLGMLRRLCSRASRSLSIRDSHRSFRSL